MFNNKALNCSLSSNNTISAFFNASVSLSNSSSIVVGDIKNPLIAKTTGIFTVQVKNWTNFLMDEGIVNGITIIQAIAKCDFHVYKKYGLQKTRVAISTSNEFHIPAQGTLTVLVGKTNGNSNLFKENLTSIITSISPLKVLNYSLSSNTSHDIISVAKFDNTEYKGSMIVGLQYLINPISTLKIPITILSTDSQGHNAAKCNFDYTTSLTSKTPQILEFQAFPDIVNFTVNSQLDFFGTIITNDFSIQGTFFTWQVYDTNNQRPITSGDHSNLYIPSYTLTSGTVYLVTVNYSMNGVIDTQSYYFKTYSKPSGGFISVTPSSGEGYTTNFQLITGNWTDPDLKFRFGYYQSISEKGNVEKGDLGNPFYLSLFDTNQKITFKLPNFDTNNIIVTVFVIAKNQYGILEQIVQNMTVSPAPNSQTLFETFALEIILTNKNPSELINNVYVAFGLLDISFVKELQTETRINKLIQMLSSLSSDEINPVAFLQIMTIIDKFMSLLTLRALPLYTTSLFLQNLVLRPDIQNLFVTESNMRLTAKVIETAAIMMKFRLQNLQEIIFEQVYNYKAAVLNLVKLFDSVLATYVTANVNSNISTFDLPHVSILFTQKYSNVDWNLGLNETIGNQEAISNLSFYFPGLGTWGAIKLNFVSKAWKINPFDVLNSGKLLSELFSLAFYDLTGKYYPVSGLIKQISLTFNVKYQGPDSNKDLYSCKYWNYEDSTWSTEGCTTTQRTLYSAEKRLEITCQCSHLTDFAIVEDLPTVVVSDTNFNYLLRIYILIFGVLTVFFIIWGRIKDNEAIEIDIAKKMNILPEFLENKPKQVKKRILHIDPDKEERESKWDIFKTKQKENFTFFKNFFLITHNLLSIFKLFSFKFRRPDRFRIYFARICTIALLDSAAVSALDISEFDFPLFIIISCVAFGLSIPIQLLMEYGTRIRGTSYGQMRNSSNLALIIIFLYTVVSVIGVIAISSNMSEEGNRVAIATFVIQYVWDFFINQTIKTGLNYYMFKNYRNIETRFIRKLLVLLIDRNFYDPRVSLSRL